MKKSIFRPLMWLGLSVILTSAVVMGSIHILLINRYTISSKTNTMLQNAQRISELTAAVATVYNSQLESFYRLNMNLVAQSTQSYIIITDTKGGVVNFSGPSQEVFLSKSIDISAFDAVLGGENLFKVGVFDSLFGKKVFTVAVPVTINGTVYGVVFFNSPMPEVQKDRSALFSMLAVSIVASSLVAFILSYVLSKQLIKPIRGLSGAAHELARGRYDRRVEVGSIAELAELATAFNTMAEAIEKHERVRAAFVANVSHDLRTPMTTISGFVEGILDGTIAPSQQTEYLKIVSAEAKRLSRLVSTFIDISKYEEDKATLNQTAFDIIEMLRVVMLSFEAALHDKDISVSFEYEDENIFVIGDENEIHRVVQNLMDNAVKFTLRGGAIRTSVRRQDKKIYVSVSNTGEGISDADKQYIWDRFYKTDRSRTRNDDGFGLGLFIVRSIIRQHGEQIILDNQQEQTTFTFTLPSA